VAILQLGEAHVPDARAPSHFPLTQAFRPAVFHDSGTEGAPFFRWELSSLFGNHSAASSDDSAVFANFCGMSRIFADLSSLASELPANSAESSAREDSRIPGR
jgi:hypothetical protein